MSLSIAETILEATQTLRRANVADARREAASLLAAVLDVDRTFIITHAADQLSTEVLATFRAGVARRAQGEPLQYITGKQDFFGLEFEVNRDVLIPRPETELLVESALDLLSDVAIPHFICDVGTGSGCIAIALLHERPQARAIAVDVSEAALRVARSNAIRHGVSERITLAAGDCFAALNTETPRFDLIVSNPPYIAADDLPGLQREVRDHEPVVALTSGSDGLSIIRRLLHDAPRYLVDGGHFLMEIGFGQAAAIEQLIDPRIWNLLTLRNDLQDIPRTLILQKRVSPDN